MILVLMSILGVAAAQISMLSNQSTRYQRDYRVAYEAAQAAITDAIMDIEAGTRKDLFFAGNEDQFVADCVGGGTLKGLCLFNADPDAVPVIYTVNFASNSQAVTYGDFTGRSFASGTTGLRPALPPRYVIELLEDNAGLWANQISAEPKPRPPIYRITAMGFGPSESVYVVLQADYRKAN
jgi:type IV pilus assembly protein PilX